MTQQTGRTPYAVAAGHYASAVLAAYEGDLVAARGTVEDCLRAYEKRRADPMTTASKRYSDWSHSWRATLRKRSSISRVSKRPFGESGTSFPGLYQFRGDQIEALTLSGDLVTAHDRLAELEAGCLVAPGPGSPRSELAVAASWPHLPVTSDSRSSTSSTP